MPRNSHPTCVPVLRLTDPDAAPASQSMGCHVCVPQAERTILTLQNAKELYGLTDHELLWEKKHDTKCIMAFGPHTIVLAFRGTASLKNASADIQV